MYDDKRLELLLLASPRSHTSSSYERCLVAAACCLVHVDAWQANALLEMILRGLLDFNN
jgi:hypothetical protein